MGRTDREVAQQSAELERLLPMLMRRLFTLEPDHPALDLPLAQLRVCTILLSGPRSVSSLSQELGISVSAATQITDRLEHAGLAERGPSPEDRRSKQLRLTGPGEHLMTVRRNARIERATGALRSLSADQRERIMEALHLLLDAASTSVTPVADHDPLMIRQQT